MARSSSSRFVLRSFGQIEGLDFDKTHAPVRRLGKAKDLNSEVEKHTKSVMARRKEYAERFGRQIK